MPIMVPMRKTQSHVLKGGMPLTWHERALAIALAVVVFVVPLFVWPGLTDYNYAKTIVSLVAVSALLVLWGVRGWRHDGWTIRIPWAFLPVVGLIVAALVSSIDAASTRLAVQSTLVLTWFASLALLTSNVAQTERVVQWILAALVVSGVLAASYGWLQYAGMLPGPEGATGIRAIVSTMGNRNHLGGFLLYLFFPASILLIRCRAWWRKALVLLALSLFGATLLLVQQTGVRVTFVLVTLALLVGALIFSVRKPIRANRWWIAALVSILLLSAAVTFVNARRTETNVAWLATEWQANSARARTWDWWIGYDMFRDHPATGVGLGLYKVEFIESRADFLATDRGQSYDRTFSHASQAHNEYVQAAAEMGIAGLVMIVGLLATSAISLWRRLRRTRDADRLDLLLLSAGILAFLIHSLVSFPAHVVGSSLAMVVLSGLLLSPAYGTGESFTLRLRGVGGKLVSLVLAVVAVAVATFAVCDAHANALMERGIAEIQAGRLEAGEALLERSLVFDFAPRQTFYYLGIAQIQLGKLDAAEANLARCMTRFVDEAALLNYANLLVNTGQSERALEPLTLLLESGPRPEIDPRARYLYAMAVSETGDPMTAVGLIERLLSEYPEYETPYIGLGGIYASMHRWDEARATYEAGLALIGSLEAGIRSSLRELGDDISSDQVATFSAQLQKLAAEWNVLEERLNGIPPSDTP